MSSDGSLSKEVSLFDGAALVLVGACEDRLVRVVSAGADRGVGAE